MKFRLHLPVLVAVSSFLSCDQQNSKPSIASINAINLKRGALISCGPEVGQLGTVSFDFSGSNNVKKDFNLGIKLLHSFEYDEAEKVFASIIDQEPTCAMAYWGVAMSNFHPLWSPPTEEELKKGSKAIEIAKSLSGSTERESSYINAVASFYNDWQTVDHRTRCLAFERSMQRLYENNLEDKEAAIFYALALNAAADPTDKTFSRQRKAGVILFSLFPSQPDHPGVVHYLIHTYDSPELAHLGLPAARKYASVAPSSAHALHMPSHIFTRLGYWDESIQSNLASVESAKCYAESSGIKGHWDEELHGMDYLVYAYLQKGDNEAAKKQWDYMKTMKQVFPYNFKVSYSFAAIPARYVLENKLWEEAANLEPHDPNLDWKKQQWQKAIIHFTRLLGAVHTNKLDNAKKELEILNSLQKELLELKDAYKANQVAIQKTAGEAWMKYMQGNNNEALKLMRRAAAMEDSTEKHPVTPGEVLPARELLADMLLQMNMHYDALKEYEEDLRKHPNRFNGLYGAAVAAERAGEKVKANKYFKQLLKIAGSISSQHGETGSFTSQRDEAASATSQRAEIDHAKKYLAGA